MWKQVELMIKIPELTYKATLERGALAICNDNDIFKWIKNGIPLPEGHGRLIDADALLKKHLGSDYDCRLTRGCIDSEITIIEADTVEREE